MSRRIIPYLCILFSAGLLFAALAFTIKGQDVRWLGSEGLLHVASSCFEVMLAIIVVELYLENERRKSSLEVLRDWIHDELSNYDKLHASFVGYVGGGKWAKDREQFLKDRSLSSSYDEVGKCIKWIDANKTSLDQRLMSLNEKLTYFDRLVGRFSDPELFRHTLVIREDTKAFKQLATGDHELYQEYLKLNVAISDLRRDFGINR